jgi:hypothetical protein
MSKRAPKLRTVHKSIPPYPLNNFPKEFPYLLGKEIVYLLATKGNPSLEGSEWEEIFATCIGAIWKPSNVGLDDVVLGNTAWGAKTIKAANPSRISRIRLISGRNSPVYSYDESVNVHESNPDELGELILEIWNERVTAIREKYKNLRTIVLIKSSNLCELVVFEFETIRYDPEIFHWQWNKRNNLEGFDKHGDHKFTWQPHGSQFTIIEEVPYDKLIIKLKEPPIIDKNVLLESIGYSNDWVTVIKNG